ncbi:ribosylnicotinamide kinase [Lecanora helva]
MAAASSSLPPSCLPSQAPPILIAISGPTSTGKTTLTHALTHILPLNPHSLTIIHADDFYHPNSAIPTRADLDGLQDWDCAEAIDWERFWDVLVRVKGAGADVEEVLGGVRAQGGILGGDDEEGGGDGVHAPSSSGGGRGGGQTRGGVRVDVLEGLREEVGRTWPEELLRRRRIVVVEGILLFGATTPARFRDIFDIRILLRTTRAKARERREGRNGYVTLEGFWQDPPGYFDRVVWPGYVKGFGGFFEKGDVEGVVREGVEGEGVVVQPLKGEREGTVEEGLEWLVSVLREEIKRVVEGEREGSG